MTATPLRLFVPRGAAVRLSLTVLPVAELKRSFAIAHSLLPEYQEIPLSDISLRITVPPDA